jgi:hypothetical protein
MAALRGWSRFKICKQKPGDNVAGSELARSFLLFIEKQVEQSREESGLNIVKVLESQSGS